MFEALLEDEKTLAALIALAGVLSAAMLNLYRNFRSARAARRLPFLEAQLDACLRACRAAGGIVASRSTKERNAHEIEFWALYWGELVIVEDRDVESAMVIFGERLCDKALEERDRISWLRLLEQDALRLAKSVRNLILKSWKITLSEVGAREEAYAKRAPQIQMASWRNPD